MRLFVFAIAFLAATVQAQVTVTGTVVDPSNAAVAGATVNLGAQNTVYSGGDKASYLLLPVIPAK